MAIGFSVGGSLGQAVPDKGFTRQNTPRVHIAQFGDGYMQRVGDGINRLSQTFSLSFANRAKADIDSITNFLETKGGVDSFNFTYEEDGSETTIKVLCSDWAQSWAYADYYDLKLKLVRVYE
jgi:phage-related protein